MFMTAPEAVKHTQRQRDRDRRLPSDPSYEASPFSLDADCLYTSGGCEARGRSNAPVITAITIDERSGVLVHSSRIATFSCKDCVTVSPLHGHHGRTLWCLTSSTNALVSEALVRLYNHYDLH